MCYVDLTGVFVVVATVEIVHEQKKTLFSLFFVNNKEGHTFNKAGLLQSTKTVRKVWDQE